MSRTCPTCGKKWGTLWPADMRAMRQRAGLTLREMEKRTGFDFSYLSKIECGLLPVSRRVDDAYRSLAAGCQSGRAK